MHFRITIASLADGKKDEAVSYVKENVFPEFDGVPGLMSMTAAITGETSGVNMATWESKEAMDAAVVKLEAELDSAEEEALFESATAYMGPVYAGKIFVEFTEGSTPS